MFQHQTEYDEKNALSAFLLTHLCIHAHGAITCLLTYHATPKTMVIFRCFLRRRKVKHLPLVFASAGKWKFPHMFKQFRYFEDCLCSSFTNLSSRTWASLVPSLVEELRKAQRGDSGTTLSKEKLLKLAILKADQQSCTCLFTTDRTVRVRVSLPLPKTVTKQLVTQSLDTDVAR